MPREREQRHPSSTNVNHGHAWVLGDDISTDHIISGKYLEIRDFATLATHVFEGVIKDFPGTVKSGDIIIAGENFGSGSSREQAPYLLKLIGIGLVVARSFARIFYRNAINVGLPVFTITTSEKITRLFQAGDEVEYSIEPASLKNTTGNTHVDLVPNPPFIMEILRDGGAIPSLRKKIEHIG